MSEGERQVEHGGPAPPAAPGPGFDSLVGQETIVTALRAATARGRLPHALLFHGPPGVGKATCAGILAQALECLERGPEEACGSCVACSKVARGLHPDVTWVTAPEDKGKISIKDIRKVNEEVSFRPHEGRRRVVVIDEAHRLGTEAQNALLKTLEEPPGSALIVLVTSSPARLLPTVRSRCQSLRFSPVGQSEVQGFLEVVHGMDPEEARLRAALTPGSIGLALEVDLDDYRKLLDEVLEALKLAWKGGAGIVAAAEELAGLGEGRTGTEQTAAALHVARGAVRDLLVLASGADEGMLVNLDRADEWRDQARDLDVDALGNALVALDRGVERLTTGIQPNIKMSLERTLLQFHRALVGDGAVAS